MHLPGAGSAERIGVFGGPLDEGPGHLAQQVGDGPPRRGRCLGELAEEEQLVVDRSGE